MLRKTLCFCAILAFAGATFDTQTRSVETVFQAITPCWSNRSLSQVMYRMPSSLQNLIGVIRTFENSAAGNQFVFDDLPGTLYETFQVEGVVLNYLTLTSNGANAQYTFQPMITDVQALVRDHLFTQTNKNFPVNGFNWNQACSLTRMISHSVDFTKQSVTEQCTTYNQIYSAGNNRNKRYAIQPATTYTSTCPVENGVITTPYGTIAPGYLMAGLAAGLRRQTSISLSSFLAQAAKNQLALTTYSSATLDNLYAGTFSSLIAAYMNDYLAATQLQPPLGTTGNWNNTAYAYNYRLSTASVSYITAAQARGVIDGFILGYVINNIKSNMKLSQLLAMYYSDAGVPVQGKFLRACDRYTLINSVDTSALQTQISNFIVALRFSSKSVINIPFESIAGNVTAALGNFKSLISQMSSSTTDKCVRDTASLDQNPITSADAIDLYIVMDYSSDGVTYFNQQKSLITALAQQMNVSPWGSRINIMSSANNTFILSMNQTTNGGEIANFANNLTYSYSYSGAGSSASSSSSNMTSTLSTLFNLLTAEQADLVANKLSGSNTKVIFYISMGTVSMDQGTINNLINMIRNFNSTMPDYRLMFYTTSANVGTYQQFVQDRNRDVITYTGNGPTAATSLINSVFLQVPKRIFYTYASTTGTDNAVSEADYKYTGYVTPGYANLFGIDSYYFWTSSSLKLTFQANAGTINLCIARTVADLNSTTSTNRKCSSLTAGQAQDITISKPCSSSGWRNCDDIYFTLIASVTSQSLTTCSGSDYYSLASTSTRTFIPKCQFPTSIQFTLTHTGMRGSAMGIVTSPITVLLAVMCAMRQFFL